MGNGERETGGESNRRESQRAFAPWTEPGARPLVRFDAVSKQFSGVAAVEQVSLDIFAGEFFALLGPSGCGKTTLLRMLAGFVVPDSGRIWFGDRDVTALPVHRRGVGMVFQDYALFPDLSLIHI